MGRLKSHRKSKSQRERDRFVGSWLWVEGSSSKIGSWCEGSGSPTKSKVRGSKALGWRSVRGFVDRRSRRCDRRSQRSRRRDRQSWRRDRFVNWWVRRSAKSKSKAVIDKVGEVKVEGSLSLSLSLFAWVRKWFEVKIFTLNHLRVKAFKKPGQLKIISGKFIFYVQPNTRIYGKTFSEVIWSKKKT